MSVRTLDAAATRAAKQNANLFQIGSGWFPERKGGAENIFYHLYEGLAGEGFSVRGVVPGSESVAHQTGGRMHGFAAQHSSLPRRALAIRRASRASFAQVKPDLVASHFALYSLPLLKQFAAPLVVHFHGPWAMESAVEGAAGVTVRCKRAIERLVYRRAERIVVLSHAFGRLLQEQYGIPGSVIRVVPGGVECERFTPALSRVEARARLGWELDRPAVFVLRRLVRRMGLDSLLDAVALLRREHRFGSRDLVLHVAGTGPERVALEQRALALGLADAVRFEGAIPDDRLALAYRAADVTLLPTAALEGFGLVAIESLASGTPLLVTPVGGLPEVAAALSEAMVLHGTDAPSIADGLACMLADPAFLPDPQACVAYARRHFDWRVVTPQIAAVYREVM